MKTRDDNSGNDALRRRRKESKGGRKISGMIDKPRFGGSEARCAWISGLWEAGRVHRAPDDFPTVWRGGCRMRFWSATYNHMENI